MDLLSYTKTTWFLVKKPPLQAILHTGYSFIEGEYVMDRSTFRYELRECREGMRKARNNIKSLKQRIKRLQALCVPHPNAKKIHGILTCPDCGFRGVTTKRK